jgi:hypothetical protein
MKMMNEHCPACIFSFSSVGLKTECRSLCDAIHLDETGIMYSLHKLPNDIQSRVTTSTFQSVKNVLEQITPVKDHGTSSYITFVV